MNDPYWEMSQIAVDADMHARLTACASREGIPEADTWVWVHTWQFAAQPGWAADWAAAVAGGNQTPGRDPAVITDGAILSAVQGMLTT